jgi:hypothetical protein
MTTETQNNISIQAAGNGPWTSEERWSVARTIGAVALPVIAFCYPQFAKPYLPYVAGLAALYAGYRVYQDQKGSETIASFISSAITACLGGDVDILAAVEKAIEMTSIENEIWDRIEELRLAGNEKEASELEEWALEREAAAIHRADFDKTKASQNIGLLAIRDYLKICRDCKGPVPIKETENLRKFLSDLENPHDVCRRIFDTISSNLSSNSSLQLSLPTGYVIRLEDGKDPSFFHMFHFSKPKKGLLAPGHIFSTDPKTHQLDLSAPDRLPIFVTDSKGAPVEIGATIDNPTKEKVLHISGIHFEDGATASYRIDGAIIKTKENHFTAMRRINKEGQPDCFLIETPTLTEITRDTKCIDETLKGAYMLFLTKIPNTTNNR